MIGVNGGLDALLVGDRFSILGRDPVSFVAERLFWNAPRFHSGVGTAVLIPVWPWAHSSWGTPFTGSPWRWWDGVRPFIPWCAWGGAMVLFIQLYAFYPAG